MAKTYEYNEGTEALDKFKQGMTALFKVPKDAVVKAEKKAHKKRAKAKKTSELGVYRDSGGAA